MKINFFSWEFAWVFFLSPAPTGQTFELQFILYENHRYAIEFVHDEVQALRIPGVEIVILKPLFKSQCVDDDDSEWVRLSKTI